LSEIEERIAVLDDASAPVEAKLDASRTLETLGKASIGPLIARLGQAADPVFLEDAVVEPGPMSSGPAARVPVSVKFEVERILYAIVYPDDFPGMKPRPPKDAPPVALANLQAKFDVGRDALTSEDVARPPIAFIEDWPTWWKEHQGESLAEIRKWARREVARTWSELRRQTEPSP